MPRPKFAIPNLRHHRATGRAFIKRAGEPAVYFGRWGSREAKQSYDRYARDLAAGRPPRPPARTLLVGELIDRFREHAAGYYRHPDGTPTSELEGLRLALRRVREMYADLPAADFGPKALKAVRDAMVPALSRKTANAYVNKIRRAFRWAAAEELIPGGVVEALRAVAALKKGRTGAAERGPVPPVPDAAVDATLPHLPATIAGMVRVQRLTGMRPQDVRGLTPGELDTAGAVWVYRPAKHKTAYREDSHAVHIGPKAQAVLRPYLEGLPPDDPVFSPARAKAERKEMSRKVRKSKVQPSQADRAKPAPARRTPRFFTSSGYASAIETAAARAGVPHWSPNQLRHTHGTEVRAKYGLEAAQHALGHKHARTTEIYAVRDAALAEKVASEIG